MFSWITVLQIIIIIIMMGIYVMLFLQGPHSLLRLQDVVAIAKAAKELFTNNNNTNNNTLLQTR